MVSFDDPSWNLEQAVAWIACGDRELLEACSPSSLGKLHDKGFDTSGNRHNHPLTIYIGRDEKALGDFQQFHRAAMDLLGALRAGLLTASALLRDPKRRYEFWHIPPRSEMSRLHWTDYEISLDYYGFKPVARNGGASPYYEIRLDRLDVLRLWPEKPIAERLTSGAEHQAKREICQMMKETPHKQPAPKQAIKDDIRGRIAGLSEAAFERAWNDAKAELKPEGWGRAGRPAKNPGAKSSRGKSSRQ